MLPVYGVAVNLFNLSPYLGKVQVTKLTEGAGISANIEDECGSDVWCVTKDPGTPNTRAQGLAEMPSFCVKLVGLWVSSVWDINYVPLSHRY